MRRVSAVLLLSVVSLPLIGPAISARDVESKLPSCCRRDGTHHCAGMAKPSESSGLSLAGGRCLEFPVFKVVPVTRLTGLFEIAQAEHSASLTYDSVHPQKRSLLSDSFAHYLQKRGPPALL